MEAMRVSSVAMFGGDPFGSRSQDMLLLSAVYVGHVERRRMAAGKIAEYAGVPRATAIRRLALLEAEGFVTRDTRGAFGLGERFQRAEVDAATAACVGLITRAAADLSKLDTQTIATWPSVRHNRM